LAHVLVGEPASTPDQVRGRLSPQHARKEARVIEPRDRLIVALDLPSVAAADAMVARLGDAISFYKIGYQLAFAGGLAVAERLVGAGKQVFLDLKLHDIGNTVAKGVESVARSGAAFLTVHAYPQTMKAAVDARGSSNLRILAVTVLTSYDDADLAAAGYDFTVAELVAERTAQARDMGVDGIVCSAEEAANLRGMVGHSMTLVTPGIRPAGSETGDQKRIMTPAAAIAAGADYLVVGRPVVAASDPRAAAQAIVDEIAAAASSVV
jgi:orotidine-5'-phosphate decarboxylase